MIKRMLKRFICRVTTGHSYKLYRQQPIHFGMGKMFVYRCGCGSEMAEFI